METNKNLEFVKNDSQIMHQLSERSAPRCNDRSITSYHAHAASMNLIRILKEINPRRSGKQGHLRAKQGQQSGKAYAANSQGNED